MKSRCVGNSLDMILRGQVVIISRNCRKLSMAQGRDCLRKHERGIEIGIVCAAAVSSPPTGINGEWHKVGKPPDLTSPCRFATRQGAKLVQTHCSCALRTQVGVNETKMGDLIF